MLLTMLTRIGTTCADEDCRVVACAALPFLRGMLMAMVQDASSIHCKLTCTQT